MAAPKECRRWLDALSDYVDGTVGAEICAQIERHMADCENCRVVVDTLRRTVHLYRTLPDPDLPESARARLYRSLDLEAYLNRG